MGDRRLSGPPRREGDVRLRGWGVLFSASELETAVRLGCNLVHLVWIVVQFAEAFGARGLTIGRPDDIVPTLKRALDMPGPVVVGVPVDYRDNQLHEWGLGSNRFLGEV